MIAARPLLPVPVVVGKGRLGSALAAAPAFSGGAVPTMSSVVSPNTGPRPTEMITEEVTMIHSPSAPVW